MLLGGIHRYEPDFDSDYSLKGRRTTAMQHLCLRPCETRSLSARFVGMSSPGEVLRLPSN